MINKRERLALTPEQKEDALRLREKWNAFRAQKPKVRTQEWLAAECGWGTQGAATQYLNGIIPLNLPALLKLSRAIGFRLADVSPSLAAQLSPHSANESDPPVYSKEAHEAARFVDNQPEDKRQGIVLGMKILLGARADDAAVVAASNNFIAPNSPLKLTAKKTKPKGK